MATLFAGDCQVVSNDPPVVEYLNSLPSGDRQAGKGGSVAFVRQTDGVSSWHVSIAALKRVKELAG